MAFAIWAKPVAETKLTLLKGFGKALKTWRELFQQAVLRKPVPKSKIQGVEIARIEPKDRCLFGLRPSIINRQKSTLQARIFQNVFAKTTSKSLARELRRQSAQRLSSSTFTGFRHVPIMSLVGITLGVNLNTIIDDGNERMMSEIREMFQDFTWQTERLEKLPTCLDDLDINQSSFANGCEGAVYMAKVKADAANTSTELTSGKHHECESREDGFDLAVKAVFNYGAESNSQSILREMEREIVPLRPEGCTLNSELGQRVNRLPPHPNIVDMPGYFVDDMLVTEEGLRKFPAAMPRRLDQEKCYGRNKTLYLLMRRRSCNLREFLARPENELTMEKRCQMLGQMLAGVSHMSQHGVAHRDLKTDNILVEVPSNGGVPRLEICDFGCCLAEEDKSLVVSFPSRDLTLGGNSWLMAPEISSANPGPDSILNFRKSDLWAVGAIAYEILGVENPFYPSKDNTRKQLSSRSYSEDQLPPLPDDVPVAVRRLVKALLSRDPRKRPSANAAAAVMQIVALQSQDKSSKSCAKKSNTESGLKGGKSHMSTRKRRLSGTESRSNGESNSKCTNVLASVKREREMLQWILGKGLALICRLTFGNQSAAWSMEDVANFLFFSRFSYEDFKGAMKFF